MHAQEDFLGEVRSLLAVAARPEAPVRHPGVETSVERLEVDIRPRRAFSPGRRDQHLIRCVLEIHELYCPSALWPELCCLLRPQCLDPIRPNGTANKDFMQVAAQPGNPRGCGGPRSSQRSEQTVQRTARQNDRREGGNLTETEGPGSCAAHNHLDSVGDPLEQLRLRTRRTSLVVGLNFSCSDEINEVIVYCSPS